LRADAELSANFESLLARFVHYVDALKASDDTPLDAQAYLTSCQIQEQPEKGDIP